MNYSLSLVSRTKLLRLMFFTIIIFCTTVHYSSAWQNIGLDLYYFLLRTLCVSKK